MNEFELIEQLIQEFGDLTKADFIDIGPGDDAAVVAIADDHRVIISTDSLVPDVHFPAGARSDLVGYRAVAINVSDVVAMGGRPLGMTIALTVDAIDREWVRGLTEGISVAAREFGLRVFGGNLARGPLNVTITVHGEVPVGAALLRSGARVSDDIWITGTLGATQAYLSAQTEPCEPLEDLLERRDSDATIRYFLPHPRVEYAIKIRPFVHAAIDVSDGLVSDLRHVLDASQCGALIQLDRVPVWRGLDVASVVGPDDSYELLFTADKRHRTEIVAAGHATGTPLVVLGEILQEQKVRYLLDGKEVVPESGYDHFA